MYIEQWRSRKPGRPAILVVQPNKDLAELIRDDLVDQGYNVIIVHTCDAALAALDEHPELVILDVVMSSIDSGILSSLIGLRKMQLLPLAEFGTALQRYNCVVYAEERQRAGIALAEAIRRQMPSIPVLFTSTDRMLLQSLPFGDAFCLMQYSEALLHLIERMLSTEEQLPQAEQCDTSNLVSLPRTARAMAMLAVA